MRVAQVQATRPPVRGCGDGHKGGPGAGCGCGGKAHESREEEQPVAEAGGSGWAPGG